MIQRIKEVLLTQYIGAIVIALLATDGILTLIRFVVEVVEYSMPSPAAQPAGPFQMNTAPPPWHWWMAVPYGVTAALQLLIAYFLLRWLYLAKSPEFGQGDDADQAAAEANQ